MKRILLFAAFAALALAQQSSSPKHGVFNVTADAQRVDGKIYQLDGHAKLESDTVILRADSIIYDETSGEIRPSGNVVLKLK
jgi:hypothetical protein